VSVLMGVFNEEDSLPRTLESIRDQTYTDWELLVIDDASTDGTRAVLDRFASVEPRLTALHHATNCGLAACLNLGLRHARGDLVARIDGDDRSMRERLERQVVFMDEHPEISVVGTASVVVDKSGRTWGVSRRPELHDDLARRMYKECPFRHPSVMMRRDFLVALGGYDERLRRAQDLDLWLRAYRRFRFHNLQEPLIEYRAGGRPSLRTLFWAPYVLARSAKREHMLLSRGWYAPRWLAALLLAWLGVRPVTRRRRLDRHAPGEGGYQYSGGAYTGG
jgi:glycosyltransferase involved in cell wall biosynthesis